MPNSEMLYTAAIAASLLWHGLQKGGVRHRLSAGGIRRRRTAARTFRWRVGRTHLPLEEVARGGRLVWGEGIPFG